MWESIQRLLGIDRKRLYIEHVAYDESDGNAFYGPFRRGEIDAEINSGYADLLADCGNLDVVEMKDSEARKIWINSRKWWRSQ